MGEESRKPGRSGRSCVRILHAQTYSGFGNGTDLESAPETDPLDPRRFAGDHEFDAEEGADRRKDALRPCTHDGLFVEQAGEWLLDPVK